MTGAFSTAADHCAGVMVWPDEEGFVATTAAAEVISLEGFSEFEVVGRGGSATVYRARQAQFDRFVAIKAFDLEFESDAQQRRFERECAVTGSLSGHPYIVEFHDAGISADADGRPYIVMRFMSKGSLQERLRASGPLSPGEVASVGVVVSTALQSAHRRRIIHRDVKPANILVSEYDEVALSDFGVATIDAAVAATETTAGMTPAHAPPEAFDGNRSSVEGDIYSLGSTMYTLLNGRPPFRKEPDEGLLSYMRRVSEDAPEPLSLPAPATLDELIMACLSKDPGDRPRDAVQVIAALHQVQTELGLPLAPTPGLSADDPTDPPVRPTSSSGSPRLPHSITLPSTPSWSSDSVTPTAVDALTIPPPTDPPTGGTPPTAPPPGDPPASGPPVADPPRRRAAVVAAIAVALVAVLATAGFAAGRILGTDVTTTTAPPSSTTSTSSTTAVPGPAPVMSAAGAPEPSAAGRDGCGSPQSYEPDNMIDGSPDTAWRMNGNGVGKTVTIYLAGPAVVRSVGLVPGFAKVDPCDQTDRFYQARRITRGVWNIGGTEVPQTFTETKQLQSVPVDATEPVGSVTFTITGVTEPGDSDRDFTAISDVGVG